MPNTMKGRQSERGSERERLTWLKLANHKYSWINRIWWKSINHCVSVAGRGREGEGVGTSVCAPVEGSFCKDFECKSTVSKLYQLPSAQQPLLLPLPLPLPLPQLTATATTTGTATPSLGPSKQIMKTNANSRQQNTKQIAGDSEDANAKRSAWEEEVEREKARQGGGNRKCTNLSKQWAETEQRVEPPSWDAEPEEEEQLSAQVRKKHIANRVYTTGMYSSHKLIRISLKRYTYIHLR